MIICGFIPHDESQVAHFILMIYLREKSQSIDFILITSSPHEDSCISIESFYIIKVWRITKENMIIQKLCFVTKKRPNKPTNSEKDKLLNKK